MSFDRKSFVRFVPVLAGLSLGLASLPTAVEAAIINLTVTGTVGSTNPNVTSIDQTGIFGTPGASLAGQNFSLALSYDTSTAANGSDSASFRYYGGSIYSLPPLGVATLTINGYSFSVGGSFETEFAGNSGNVSTQLRNISGPGYGDQSNTHVYTNDTVNFGGTYLTSGPTDPTDVGVFDFDQNANPYGDFVVSEGDLSADGSVIDFVNVANLSLLPEQISFNEAASVPEPANWAMMVGGFALIGGALRRKRVAVAFA